MEEKALVAIFLGIADCTQCIKENAVIVFLPNVSVISLTNKMARTINELGNA